MSQRARVLVIDDDPLFRSVISALLRDDYAVQVAADGSEAFFRALEKPPEAAVIDLRMPNWDGLKTLRAFRTHPSLGSVKVLMLSAHTDARTVDAVMGAGADDLIIKTRFSPDEFLQKMARLLPISTPTGDSQSGGLAGNATFPWSANGSARRTLESGLDNKPQPATEAARLQAILDDWN